MTGMKSRGRSGSYAIEDSKPWKADCWAEADLGRWLEEEGTLWLEEGSETGWWTYGMGVDVYGRDEGGVGGGRQEGGRKDETKGNRSATGGI